MTKITIEVPDELSDKIVSLGDRFPEILALSLQQPAIPAHIYRYIINFIARQPTPEEINNFRPTEEMQLRLKTLLNRSKTGELTDAEREELNEYESIEHLIVMLKTGNLSYTTSQQ